MTIEERVSLARYSTLHVGGMARAFTRISSLEGLRSALSWAEEAGLPWFVLGGGSNFFCREEGFPGLVIKMENREIKLGYRGQGTGDREVVADAGMVLRSMIYKAVEQGLRGMEHLAGIPGTVGGAVRGNAGSFGSETKDALERVNVLKRTSGGWVEDVLSRSELQFSYRTSLFKLKPKEFVIWHAVFALESGDRSEGERLIAEDALARKAGQPYEFPSVGSVFKNPSPEQSAGRLIDQAGLKGFRVGGLEVSAKHANFIVNLGHGTAADAQGLIAEMKKRVFETSGIQLEEEIVVL